MDQHAIPQQISSYQFRLVGSMTLKQFFQVGGGALVSLIFYSTNLHPIIKWPLIILSFAFGVALAFLPIQDRPLEKWIVLFIKAAYSPTLYFWKKLPKETKYFQDEDVTTQPSTQLPPTETPSKEPLKIPTTQVISAIANLEKEEQSFLTKVSHLFISPRDVAEPIPAAHPREVSQPTPTIPKRHEPQQSFITAQIKPQEQPQKEHTTATATINYQQRPMPTPVGSAQEVKPVNIPQVQVADTSFSKDRGYQEPSGQPSKKLSEEFMHIATPQITPAFQAKKADLIGKQAQFSQEAAPPNLPTRANTVVGQVFDHEGKIVPGAILEIKDAQGRPVRALKSNALGHFITVTPLYGGRYEIITEKEGFGFEPVVFEAKGDVIPPIAVKAQRTIEVEQPN